MVVEEEGIFVFLVSFDLVGVWGFLEMGVSGMLGSRVKGWRGFIGGGCRG